MNSLIDEILAAALCPAQRREGCHKQPILQPAVSTRQFHGGITDVSQQVWIDHPPPLFYSPPSLVVSAVKTSTPE